MTRQYTVLWARKYQVRDGSGTTEKTHWTHIGRAFEAKSGDGMDCTLYLVPPPNERGEYRILIRPDDKQAQYDRPRGQEQQQRGPEQQRRPEHRDRPAQGGYGPQSGQHQDEVPMPGGEDDLPF